MCGADGPPFSNSGQCPAPSVDGCFQHGPRSAGIQGGPNAITPHQTSQPRTHGASDAEWNATLDGNSQGRVGPRRQCREDGNRFRPNVVGRDLVGTERGAPTREANRVTSHAQANQGDFIRVHTRTYVGRGSRLAPDAGRVGSIGPPDEAHGAGDNMGDAPDNRVRTLASIRRGRLRLQLARTNRVPNTNGGQAAGVNPNGASDASVIFHANGTPNGASDARSNPNGASDANGAPDANRGNSTTESHSPDEVNGAADARNNPNGASDANSAPDTSSATSATVHAAIGTESGAADASANHGAPVAIHGQNHGRPLRRTRGGGRKRRRPSRGNRPTEHDGHVQESDANEVRLPPPPQHPPPGTARTRIDRIMGSLPYLSTLNNRQIGSHTWSDQLVPLIWCATCDSTCEHPKGALTEAGRGHEALMAFRKWWVEQGIHTPEDAIPILNIIARQLGVRGPPIRCYQYLQAPVQEHIATLSGAELVVGSDLVRPQQASERPRTDDAPEVPSGGNARTRDTTRSVNAGTRLSTSPHGDEELEIDNSRVIGRLRYALEQYRCDELHTVQGATTRLMIIIMVQECIVWLTCSRGCAEQAEQVLTANNVGTRTSSAMHEWWTRHGVQSPMQAFTYIQGNNQSAHPDQVYGNLSTQVVKDLIQAGGASDLIMQDLTIEQSPHEETYKLYDEELVRRMGDQLLNRRCWDDREGWLVNSTWPTLPAYYHTTLEPVLREIGIDEGPFVRLNSWFATQGVRNPRDMSNRQDQIDVSPRDDDMQEEDELNTRIRHMLINAGLITELRRATEPGLSSRRSNAPHTPGPNGNTCVICWEGATENESDTLSSWPQCGHIIHRSCHSRWIWTCHTRGNVPRCPICRRNMQGQPERQDSTAADDGDLPPNRRYAPSVGEPQGDVDR